MLRTHIQSPLFFYYFILFATYGGWLMVLLTALFWEWSGASLGVFYLVLVAPFVTAGVTFSLRGSYALSVFHRVAYIASMAYSGLMVVTLGVWLGMRFFVR